MALVKFSDVTLGYNGNTVAQHIDFEINSGDYVCIVGENGSGKSTLMKALLGLHAPMSGEVSFGDGLRRDDIGYLPQQTAVQRDFPACVREVVQSGCLNSARFHPFYTRADKARARQAMEQMDITELSGKCYRELSGGQQQRVLLARAMCAAKRLLVLDEPVSGLDPQSTARMYGAVNRLRVENNLAVVMISHDAEGVQQAEFVLDMGHERMIFAPTADYMRSDAGRHFLQSKGVR